MLPRARRAGHAQTSGCPWVRSFLPPSAQNDTVPNLCSTERRLNAARVTAGSGFPDPGTATLLGRDRTHVSNPQSRAPPRPEGHPHLSGGPMLLRLVVEAGEGHALVSATGEL